MLDSSTLFKQPDDDSWKKQADLVIIEIKKHLIADKSLSLESVNGIELQSPTNIPGKRYLKKYRTARSVLQTIIIFAVFGKGFSSGLDIEIFDYLHEKLLGKWMPEF